MKKTTNYKLFIHGMMTHLFPTKALRRQKRHFLRRLPNYQYHRIRKFIWCVKNIVNDLKQFSPLVRIIIELFEFALLCEWQQQLLIQGFYLATKSLKELVEICEWLKTAKNILQDKCFVSYPIEKSNQENARHHTSLLAKRTGSNQTAKPSK